MLLREAWAVVSNCVSVALLCWCRCWFVVAFVVGSVVTGGVGVLSVPICDGGSEQVRIGAVGGAQDLGAPVGRSRGGVRSGWWSVCSIQVWVFGVETLESGWRWG